MTHWPMACAHTPSLVWQQAHHRKLHGEQDDTDKCHVRGLFWLLVALLFPCSKSQQVQVMVLHELTHVRAGAGMPTVGSFCIPSATTRTFATVSRRVCSTGWITISYTTAGLAVHLHLRPGDLPVPLPAHALDASANPKPHGQLCGDHFLGDGLCAGSHLLKRHKLEDAER